MTQHYVVEMRVIRVDIEDPPARTHTTISPPETGKRRTVTEVAKHTVKGDVFEKTIEKAQAYLALAEDIDAVDDVPKGHTR